MEMTEHSHTLEYEYVNSDYLGMTIAISPEPHKGYFENWKYMKIAVYIKMDSPYGWTKRELKHTPFCRETNFKPKRTRLFVFS